jgi:hypothetical protein
MEELPMRPGLTLALTAPVLCVGAATVCAQGDIRLGVGGGLFIPLRGYADAVNRGWFGNANLTFNPSASASLGLRLDGLYGRGSLSSFDGHQSLAGGLAGLAIQFGARRSPNRFYVFGDGGYVRAATSATGFPRRTQTSPAISAGAGAVLGGKDLAFFVEARYLTVYTDGAKPQFAPITAGASLGGL